MLLPYSQLAVPFLEPTGWKVCYLYCVALKMVVPVNTFAARNQRVLLEDICLKIFAWAPSWVDTKALVP